MLLLKKAEGAVTVDGSNIDTFLGVRKYDFGLAAKENQVGQVTGLAWTEVGGDLLTIEAAVMPGKGNVIRTGSLGDVMKESVEARARWSARVRAVWVSRTKRSRSRTFTSTCRKARRRRTVRRRYRDDNRARVGVDRYSGSRQCRDDGRNHVAW
jgi:ATP-dependent Lon protease, bacterial type